MLTNMLFSEIAHQFILNRQSQNHSPQTIKLYKQEMGYFSQWLQQKGIDSIELITAQLLREWFSDLGTVIAVFDAGERVG